MGTNQDSLPSKGGPYQPNEIEKKWYSIWEREGYFEPHWRRLQSPLLSRPSEGSWSDLNGLETAPRNINTSSHSIDPSLDITGRPLPDLSFRDLRPLAIPASVSGVISRAMSEASQQDERGLDSSETSGIVFRDGSPQNRSDTNPSTSPSLTNTEEAPKSASIDSPSEKSFTMFTPPPNITGDLHCGHALAISLEDALVRYHRMQGFKTLFLPGSDHAGVAVQCLVEKKLIREKGRDRHQIGRPRFIKHLDEWKDEYRGKISSAFRRLGASMDWTREAFTMDKALNEAAIEAFVRLYEQGVIYRGSHIVHWCPTLRTAVSEHEVETLEINGPTSIKVPGYTQEIEFGVLYYYRYVIIKDDNTPCWIEMATTRPELLLADSGIAVHPDDKRYIHLIGMNARHPYSGRLLPIVGEFTVNPKFGTGARSIAPGHSEDACEIGRRNGLQTVVVFREDGRVNEAGGLWNGQKRFELRQTVIENLEDRGLLIKREPCKETLRICSRSGDVVELMSKSQWWMRMDDIAEEAADAIREGRMKVRPEPTERECLTRLEEPKDWCLSRNIWWGQRIPAWFLSLKEEERNALKPDDSNTRRWMVARSEEEARKQGELAFPDQPFRLTRDEAVLDTWFAAAIWPLSTLGWPEGKDFDEFYPTTILDTGPDTIPFWVTRMTAVCLKLTGEVPFREVLFHPLVKDPEGVKMSNSLGNVINPIDFIAGSTLEALNQKMLEGNLAPRGNELDRTRRFQATCFPGGIPECGADALRFALVDSTSDSQSTFLNVGDVITYREFCDGLYKTVHEALILLPSDYKPTPSAYGQRMAQRIGDRYILHRLNAAGRDVERGMEDKRFWRATRGIKALWCRHIPTYLEYYRSCGEEDPDPESLSTTEALYAVIDGALRMTHPFMPFITEELWQKLPKPLYDDTPSIMVAEFPKQSPEYEYPYAEAEFNLVMDCTKAIQSLCQGNSNLESGKVYIKSACFTSQRTLEKYTSEIRQQSGAVNVGFLRIGDEAPAGSIACPVSDNVSVHLSVGHQPDRKEDISELRLKLETARRTLLRQENRLRESTLRDSMDERDRKAEEARLETYKSRVKNYERTISELSSYRA
ncbi:valine--tRNA ligase [Orbilia javanica]|uniref:valine--tRNA ligase n=1 Tax=Orbilia javanica TaxID=47235 RepID=A0AAN8MRD0_9PEZI